MMSLNFCLFTQVSDSGTYGPLVICLFSSPEPKAPGELIV